MSVVKCEIDGIKYRQVFLGNGNHSCERCVADDGSRLCRELCSKGCPCWTCWESYDEPGITVTTKKEVTKVVEERQKFMVPEKREIDTSKRIATCAEAFPGTGICCERFSCDECILSYKNRGALMDFVRSHVK